MGISVSCKVQLEQQAGESGDLEHEEGEGEMRIDFSEEINSEPAFPEREAMGR